MKPYKVYSLKYRPQKFDELIGQRHVRITLSGAINKGRVGHAYLFAGPRGVGKTTVARILAKSLNCVEGPTVNPCGKCNSCIEIASSRSMDVLEIDGASNRGIDEIRELRENVKYAPAYSRYKIYIIDEVHMLTEPAFNALLKTLEEPPASVIFIFATTSPADVPNTILSRCQRFDFRKLTPAEIVQGLEKITKQEQITITNDTLMEIARRADGSMRDAESLLEQLVTFSDREIKREDIQTLFGISSIERFFELFDGIIAKDNSRAIASLTDWLEEGANPFEVYAGIINHLRALLFIKMNIKVITEIYSEKEIKHLKDQAEHYDFLDLIRLLQIGLDFESTFRQSINSRIALELLTLRFCFIEKSVDIADLIRQYEGVRDESRGSIIDIFIDKVKEQNTAVGCSLEKAKFNIVNQKDIELVFSVRDKFHYETISDKKNISLIERVYEELMKTKPRFKIKIAEQEVEAKDSKIEMIKNLFDGEELTR